MFTLRYFNVVKIVDSEVKRDQLLAKGFTLAIPAPALAPVESRVYEDMSRDELFAACEAAGLKVVARNTKTETLIARLRGEK